MRINYCTTTGISITFSVKGWKVNVFGFAGHTVSVKAINSATVARKQPLTLCKWMRAPVFQQIYIYKKLAMDQIGPVYCCFCKLVVYIILRNIHKAWRGLLASSQWMCHTLFGQPHSSTSTLLESSRLIINFLSKCHWIASSKIVLRGSGFSSVVRVPA